MTTEQEPHPSRGADSRPSDAAGTTDPRANAGSESPEEGAAAMDAADDAVIDQNDKVDG